MIVTLSLSLSLSTPTVYASPTGQDSQPGTFQSPVRSVRKALELAGKYPGGAHRVVLGPGVYPVTRTMEMTAKIQNLRIEGGGKARILGGKVVTGWKPVTDPAVLKRLSPQARNQVRVVDLKIAQLTPGTLHYRGFADGKAPSALELFFNGQPMQIARYPNAGEWAKTEAKVDAKTFAFAANRPKSWQLPNDPWVFGYFRFDWCDTYDAVKIDAEKRTAELTREPDYGIEAKRRYYFFNVLEELDMPGEYFVDRRKGKLYFWPPRNGPSDVVASIVEGPLLHMKGTVNVVLSGISFEAGREGGIFMEGGERNRIERCLIHNFGTYGVSIQGAKNSGVAGCDLTGLGSRGIELFGGDRTTLTSANLYAEDNHIWAYSRWPRTYQAGLAIEGVGARASHNLIESAPHNAILMAGNDHKIEFNDIRNVCLETGDSGAIYMGHNLTMRGNQIRFNRFRDILPTVNTEGSFTNVMSVYLDDQWSGTTIYGNVFEGKGTGILVGGGRDNTIENNVFVGKDPALHIDQRGKDWAKDKDKGFRAQAIELRIDQPPYSVRYPQLKKLLDEDVMLATGNVFARNVIAGTRPYWFQNGLTEASISANENVIVPTMSLQDALKLVPKAIPLSRIGLKSKVRPIRFIPD